MSPEEVLTAPSSLAAASRNAWLFLRSSITPARVIPVTPRPAITRMDAAALSLMGWLSWRGSRPDRVNLRKQILAQRLCAGPSFGYNRGVLTSPDNNPSLLRMARRVQKMASFHTADACRPDGRAGSGPLRDPTGSILFRRSRAHREGSLRTLLEKRGARQHGGAGVRHRPRAGEPHQLLC